MRIHVAGVCNLALGCGVDAVDLGGCERFKGGEVEGFGKRVDSCVLEELVTGLVDERGAWVTLEIARAGDLAGEVVACVEEFEEASNGVEVLVNEVDAALLLVFVNLVSLQVANERTVRRLLH